VSDDFAAGYAVGRSRGRMQAPPTDLPH
jgi:hypothetical protein